MPNSVRSNDQTKFQRHRANRKAKGLKLLRVWTFDPRAPGFAEDAHRQALLLRGAPEEVEALAFIAAAGDFSG
jgi:hypothetical protein